ncbi:hypothetical protein SUDANB120_03048 [Streptomyces sp. enrichment culture]
MGLAAGVMVRPVELIATPWARIFNGSLSDGVAYRVARLELVQAPAMAAPAAPVAAVSESAASAQKAA